MKQLKYILTLIIGLIILSPGVKADTTYDLSKLDFISLNQVSGCSNFNNLYIYNDFDSFILNNNNKQIFDSLYTDLFNYYNKNYKNDYPYYVLTVELISSSNSEFILSSINLQLGIAKDTSNTSFVNLVTRYFEETFFSPSASSPSACSSSYPSANVGSNLSFKSLPYSNVYYKPTYLFESNYNTIVANNSDGTNKLYNIYTLSGDLLNTYQTGDVMPVYFLNGYDISTSDNYTTVNLNDYHYVLLSLKDYSQTEAFDTNLQVKGMIGITSIYDYGQVPKDNVLGSKIEDRCNVSYSDYTDYRLYVLQNDLENRAVYAVKSCQDGSSFKFDSSIFNITYVTDDNVDDPVVVIDGIEYHTVPYDQLPSTATKNEEENYIPGQSEPLSFSQIIENITESLESVWNVIATFMGLVTKFFNILPAEIRTISIATFSIACVLGIIKILKA